MFDFSVTNADGSHPSLLETEWRLEKYFDRHGTLEMQVSPESSAISENSSIEASYLSSIRFRGWIDYPEVKDDGGINVKAYEQQKLLEFRACQTYNYPAGTTVSMMLSSSVSPGLLYFANSLIPQGSFSLHSGYVYVLKDYLSRGAGTSSKFGTITSVYQGTTALTHGSSAALSAGQWYQDASDLYVRTTDNKDPKYWTISVPNWKDTLLRIGVVEAAIANETFTVPYRTGKNNIAQEISRLINAFGLEYRWRHDRDGYTYLDVQTAIGRGSSTKGVARYRHNKQMFNYERVLTGDPKVNCLLGSGSGNGYSLQTAAAIDLYSSGTWKEEIYQDSHQFTEQLSNTLAKIFPDRKDGLSYNLQVKLDPALECGDYIDITPLNHANTTQRVKKITYKSDGSMDIEAGRRLLDPVDVTKNKFDMLADFSTAANSYLNSWTFQFNNDSVTNTVPYKVNFKVQTDEIDTTYDYRFVLNLNVDWYKASTSAVATPAHSHAGTTGSGGSHAHSGETQEGGSHPHSIDDETSAATGMTSVVNVLGSTTTGSSSGAHDHLNYFVADGVAYVQAEYEDAYVECPINARTEDSSSTHNHSITPLSVSIPNFAHTHTVPMDNTNYNSDDTRGIDTMPQDTRPMNTQATSSDDLTSYALLTETGSIRYLTLTVTVNGTQVSGSPFNDYYPGESISDIDITTLVSLTAQNTIQVAISEYGGSNSVRCSLNGSVSSKYSISSI